MKSANYEIDRIFRLYVVSFIVDFTSEHGQEFNDKVKPLSADCRNRSVSIFGENLQRID